MTKVVRAFSLDQGVSEQLDWQTAVAGVSKPMNKSRFVNDALEFFMNRNLQEFIADNRSLKENLTVSLRDKDVTIQGLEQQVALLSDHSEDLANEISKMQLLFVKESQECRCLWCRLKKRLQK